MRLIVCLAWPSRGKLFLWRNPAQKDFPASKSQLPSPAENINKPCRGAGMAQWWERSPPTNVSRVWFLDPASYVGWVCCWFSALLQEVFLRVLRFSPLLKNQHSQIPIRSWNARTLLNEFLWTPWCSVGKQITIFFTFCSWVFVKWWSTVVEFNNMESNAKCHVYCRYQNCKWQKI